jgi:hypothetical protein
VSDTQEPQAEAIALDEAARAGAELARREGAERVASAFLEVVQRWATPSAVLVAVRDPKGVAGFRLLPTLCTGSISLGIEKTLARLVEDTPECLERPTLVRGEEVPGVRVRDNVVVPWWCEGDSGLLVLRGVPRPSRPGLGEALSLAAACVWPRLLGGPAGRVEALLSELRSASERLASESGRHLERLQAAAAPGPETSAAAGRVSELEQELERLQQEQGLHAEKLAEAQRQLESAHAAREAAREATEARLADAARELEAARRELEGAQRERAAAQHAHEAAQHAHEVAQRELAAAGRDRETAARDLESAVREGETARHELVAARADAEATKRELEATRVGLEATRKDLDTARRERDTAALDLAASRQHAENLKRELAAAVNERGAAERDLDAARRELAARMAAPPPVPSDAQASEAPAPAAGASLGSASDALRLAIAALRRAAFIPPMLRVSMEEVAALASREEKPARRHGIALLDRDVVALEAVAAELEQAGIEVRLANQPEELALLLRTSEASGVDAVICDVMCYRPDQNVAGILRGWDKDRPGLSFFLSYDAQSPVELERARRTPMSLTAGHIQRPLTASRLAETLENLAKRQGKNG